MSKTHFQFNKIHFEHVLQFYQKKSVKMGWLLISGTSKTKAIWCFIMKFNGSQEAFKINQQIINMACYIFLCNNLK